jgi:putative aldouronate transport system permease protein
MRLGRRRHLTLGSLAEDVLFNTAKTVVLGLLVVVTLYPFWNTIVVSFNQASDTIRGGLYFWPRQWTMNNYRVVWITSNIPQALFISVSRTVLSTVLNLFLTTMLAYALGRREYVLRRPLTLIVVLTLYVNAGLFPSYFLIRNLGLHGTFWVYVIPSMVGAFNFIVIRTYIRTIPESLIESARIDGARDFLILMRFVFPLCKPVLATVALFVAVGAWNSWFDTVLYNSRRPELFTLQYRLMAMLQASMNQSKSTADVGASGVAANISMSMVTPVSIRAAITIVAAVPILLVYPFLQKHFVVGLNVGSVKE